MMLTTGTSVRPWLELEDALQFCELDLVCSTSNERTAGSCVCNPCGEYLESLLLAETHWGWGAHFGPQTGWRIVVASHNNGAATCASVPVLRASSPPPREPRSVPLRRNPAAPRRAPRGRAAQTRLLRLQGITSSSLIAGVESVLTSATIREGTFGPASAPLFWSSTEKAETPHARVSFAPGSDPQLTPSVARHRRSAPPAMFEQSTRPDGSVSAKVRNFYSPFYGHDVGGLAAGAYTRSLLSSA
jgi:hypothetical protein